MKKYFYFFTVILLTNFLFAEKDVNQIIEKNLNARGGAKVLSSITSSEAKVITSAMGMEIPMKMYSKKPSKARVEVNFMGMNNITAFDGVKVTQSNNGKIVPLEGEDAQKAIEQMKSQSNSYENPLINYIEKGNKVTYIGTENIDGQECDVLKIVDKNGKVVNLYINTKTSIDIKMSTKQEFPDGEKDVDIFFEDNEMVSGILVPHKMSIKANGEEFAVLKFEYIKFNVNLDDSLFILK